MFLWQIDNLEFTFIFKIIASQRLTWAEYLNISFHLAGCGIERMSLIEGINYIFAKLIDTFLADRGIEIPTENNPEYYAELKQHVYGLLNALDWASVLGVYCPSLTTFNVRGGKYLLKGVVTIYTPGSNVDPTDNDTTYIWLDPDNSINSGIDGSGWPATEHVKLAEIDVDEDGIITAIRDLRGETFLQVAGGFTGNHLADLGVNGGVPFILTAAITNGNTVAIHTANAPFKYRIIDAWSVAKSADGGTWKLTDGTNDITNAVAVTATDKTVNRVGTIDDAKNEIAAAGSLSVVGGTGSDVDVYILCVRVS